MDDDEPFLRRLERAMAGSGFEVEAVRSVARRQGIATARPAAYAVVDMRIGRMGREPLEVFEALARLSRPDSKIVSD